MSSQRRQARGQAGGLRAKEPRQRPGESLGETVRTLGTALVLALVIRTFIVQTFYVPSGSMFDSLLIGDHVFVNKVLYGIRIPWIDRRLPGIRLPERGDVVVFRAARGAAGRVAPGDRRPELPREDFIKRIVGIPGDRVDVRGGKLYVNGSARIPGGETGSFEDPTGRALIVFTEEVERCRYHVLDDPGRVLPDRGPFLVEEGRYFVMGDNRDDSYDSRYFGTVRFQEIQGSAGLIYWSWDWNGSWLELLNPVTWWRNLTQRARWGRIGDSLSCG